MAVKLKSSGMQLIEKDLSDNIGNGGVGDTYLLRQQQLQAKLSVLSLYLRVSATVARLQLAASRHLHAVIGISLFVVVVIPASIVQPRCGVAAPHCGVQQNKGV